MTDPRIEIHEEMNTPQRVAFWTWLPLAYRDGHLGEEPKFTKYNMEVSHAAGWNAALDAARPLPADVARLVERAKHMMTDAEWLEERAHILAGLSHKGVAAAPEPAVYQIPDFIAASRLLVPDLTAALEAQARQIADLTETVAEVRAELDQMIDIAADWRSRAEKLGRDLNMARYGQPDFSWAVHKQAMADLTAENARLREAVRLSAIAMRKTRAVVQSSHEHGLLTGALVICAEAEAGIDARAALKGGDNG